MYRHIANSISFIKINAIKYSYLRHSPEPISSLVCCSLFFKEYILAVFTSIDTSAWCIWGHIASQSHCLLHDDIAWLFTCYSCGTANVGWVFSSHRLVLSILLTPQFAELFKVLWNKQNKHFHDHIFFW